MQQKGKQERKKKLAHQIYFEFKATYRKCMECRMCGECDIKEMNKNPNEIEKGKIGERIGQADSESVWWW